MSRKPPFTSLPGGRLPKGVEAVLMDGEGRQKVILDSIQAHVRWPGVSIDSSSFEILSVSEKLHEQALAFLKAAKVLCASAGEAGVVGKRISWSEGSVCFYCLNLGTELFLKACISRATGEPAPTTHDLPKLLQRYQAFLSGEEFQFQIPLLWKRTASDIESAIGRKLFAPIDKAPDQLYRYGIGKDGAGSLLTHIFSPGTVFNRIAHWEKVWKRAWAEAQKIGG